MEKDNINLIINKEDKANVDKSQELNKDSKYVSLSLQIEELKKLNSEMMKQIEVQTNWSTEKEKWAID